MCLRIWGNPCLCTTNVRSSLPCLGCEVVRKLMMMTMRDGTTVSNYFQNHRKYVKSIVQAQLQGEATSASALSNSDCSPVAVSNAGMPIYPCGLIANSIFNGSSPFPLPFPPRADLHPIPQHRHDPRSRPPQHLLPNRFDAHPLHLNGHLLARRSLKVLPLQLQLHRGRSSPVLGSPLPRGVHRPGHADRDPEFE